MIYSFENNYKKKNVFKTEDIHDIRGVHRERLQDVFWMITEHDFFYCVENCATLKQINIEDQDRENLFFSKLNLSYKGEFVFEIDLTKTIQKQKWEMRVLQTRNSTRISCGPFAKKTDYDFLSAISNRERLKGFPEPDLIDLVDKTGQLKIGEIRLELLNIENKQVNYFKIKLICVLFSL